MLSKRVAHLSGDDMETDGLLRRRAFSLSYGMTNSAPRFVIPGESPLVLKSSSLSSMAHAEDSIPCGAAWGSAVGELLCGSFIHSEARWPSGCDAGLAINRSRVRIPVSPLSSATLSKLLTHMCICHQAV